VDGKIKLMCCCLFSITGRIISQASRMMGSISAGWRFPMGTRLQAADINKELVSLWIRSVDRCAMLTRKADSGPSGSMVCRISGWKLHWPAEAQVMIDHRNKGHHACCPGFRSVISRKMNWMNKVIFDFHV
jgi:hypothetical protein